ncbi:tumor necrosis factor receptor superfamily member 13C isoform X1 [Antechinus flavipes]|uniref:tumor necrosis factor receptor superfamily member 13C isoform X1 n=1 Tax=Antechinus flavipes TaxID=38775 RepID=UPI0022356848|nr:tumor necrosis factor receptor superfamily member 13C isoform X1 [Antechinus flavipes]
MSAFPSPCFLSVSVSFSLSLCLCVCVSLFLSCLCLSVSLCLCISVSVCLSVILFMSLSLFLCLSPYLSSISAPGLSLSPDNISSPSETVTLMTQVSNTSVTSLFTLLPGPYLLLGIPIGLVLVLALLYGLLVCVLQRRPEGAPADTEAGPGTELAQGVNLPPHQEPKALQIDDSNGSEDHDQHPLQECDGAPEPPSVPRPSFPVPATELGAMVLVTTKTITSEL